MARRTYIIEQNSNGKCTVEIYDGHVFRDIEKAIDLTDGYIESRRGLTPEQVCDLLKE